MPMRDSAATGRTAIRLAFAAGMAAGLLAWSGARAADLPPRNQALLLLRILVYDRNLKQRAEGTVTVGVVFRPHDAVSEQQRDALVAALESVAEDVVAAGMPVKALAIPYRDPADLDARIARLRPAAVYVGAALSGSVKEIVRVTRRRSVLSVCGSREMVADGIGVGLVNRGRRAGVVVGLESTRSEGVDLDSALLAMAEVIR
jgi:hypothetical protein